MDQGKDKSEVYENIRHTFFLPKETRWSVLASAAENIEEKIDQVCRIIERENPIWTGFSQIQSTMINENTLTISDILRNDVIEFE